MGVSQGERKKDERMSSIIQTQHSVSNSYLFTRDRKQRYICIAIYHHDFLQ